MNTSPESPPLTHPHRALQTGSGKTFTMMGGAGGEEGIIPRAMANILKTTQVR